MSGWYSTIYLVQLCKNALEVHYWCCIRHCLLICSITEDASLCICTFFLLLQYVLAGSLTLTGLSIHLIQKLQLNSQTINTVERVLHCHLIRADQEGNSSTLDFPRWCLPLPAKLNKNIDVFPKSNHLVSWFRDTFWSLVAVHCKMMKCIKKDIHDQSSHTSGKYTRLDCPNIWYTS